MSNKRPIKKYNVVVSLRKYTDGEGKEKNVYRSIGEMQVWEDGGVSMELFHMPGVRITAFERTEKKVSQGDPFNTGQEAPQEEVETINLDDNKGEEGTVDVKDIPF